MSSFPASAQRIRPTAPDPGAESVEDLAALNQVAHVLAGEAELRLALAGALKSLTLRRHGGVVRGIAFVLGDARRQSDISVTEGAPAVWRRGAAARADASIRRALEGGRPVHDCAGVGGCRAPVRWRAFAEGRS